jgi:hypothetical protein
MLLPVAFIAVLALQTNTPECVAQSGNFLYPMLAKSARISGDVTVHVVIGEDGVAAVADYTGHQMLTASVATEMPTVHFAASCAGREVDLRLTYRLADALPYEDRTQRTGNNEWLIEAGPTLVTGVVCSGEKCNWWRRMFHRCIIHTCG